jgi:hypothetical protein
MQFARSEGFGSIPSATGGIARLACARLGEMGKEPAVTPTARLSQAHGRFWHETDEPARFGDVRCLGKTGSHRQRVKTACLTRVGHRP